MFLKKKNLKKNGKTIWNIDVSYFTKEFFGNQMEMREQFEEIHFDSFLGLRLSFVGNEK